MAIDPAPMRVGPPPAGPIIVAIMDGIGIGCGDDGDAVAAAAPANLLRYRRLPGACSLRAHGHAVGMPSEADMGNSEVGHNALGAGRIFDQGAKRVAAAVRDGSLFAGPLWAQLCARGSTGAGALHLIGLLSDGNVHSHIDHLLAMVQAASAAGVRRLRVHALLDGRDVPRQSALIYIDRLEAALAAANARAGCDFAIASGGGRMQVTMDRYGADWPMVARGWALHVEGRGTPATSARAAVGQARTANPGIGDQDLPGFVVHAGGRPVGPIHDGDGVAVFNFRGDRVLELVQAFEDEAFDAFARGQRPAVLFAGMTLYDGDARRPRQYLVAPPMIDATLGEHLAEAGIAQLACSETQKFGHVTYFWNGNRSAPFDPEHERWIEVPSRPAPFDSHPQMQAAAITDAVLAELGRRRTDLVRLNYANGDMVGHTGNFAATVQAVAAVDHELGRLERAALAAGGALVVVADHGNAEEMGERDGHTGALLRDAHGALLPKTSHSSSPVPFCPVLPPAMAQRLRPTGLPGAGLGNVASTLAVLLGLAPPAGYLPPLLAQTRT